MLAITSIHAKEWRGLVPLHSTRADIERIPNIQLPNRYDAEVGFYKLEQESIVVRYITGKCIEGWNIPQNTILWINITPKQPLKLSDLNLDISKFKTTRDGELPELLYYSNDEEGFQLHMTYENLVGRFVYYHTPKEESLRCGRKSEPEALDIR
jgi:hypothetical protein